MKLTTIEVDMGATSGRVVLSHLEPGHLSCEELYRFPNHPLHIGNHDYWDIYELFHQLKEGLRVAGARKEPIDSIGIDTWGVDFVFVARDGQLLGLPRAYRDPYTCGMPERFFQKMPREEVYRRTGIQIMNFNSLYQLYADHLAADAMLEVADKLLFMPDAFSYLLTGKMVCEYTILSTSQLMNPNSRSIDPALLEFAGVHPDLFPALTMPGEIIGTLTPTVAQEVGLAEIPVIAVAGHDTASAVVAVPALTPNFAYLSSGTWSLMGIETSHPLITKESFSLNFTNEGGVDGTTRVLKNITGMWLLEECRRIWKSEGKAYSYAEIMKMLQGTLPFVSFIDPDDSLFTSPENMPQAIRTYCEKHQEPIPQDDAAMIRCLFDSLALKYRMVFESLRKLAPKPLEVLHVIGGGARNECLNQMIADSLQVTVIAGPSEATTLGNMMLQARSAGMVGPLQEMRQWIAVSVETHSYFPGDARPWDRAYQHFLNIISFNE